MIKHARILCQAVVLAATFVGVVTTFRATPAEAAQDYCRWSKRKLVIMVDRTTAYDKVDEDVLKGAFSKIVREFEPGDRLVVQNIVDDYTRSQRTFEGCVPGCPDVGFMGWLNGECRAVVARADRPEFEKKLAIVVLDILRQPLQFEQSDILRTISDNTHVPLYGEPRLERFYVFSDLIENTKAFPWSTFRKQDPKKTLERVKADGILPHLEGAQVVVFGFGRLHDPGRPALAQAEKIRLEQFWTGFFNMGGASSVRIGLRYD